MLLLLLSACNPNEKKELGSVFRFNISSAINSLDPAFAKDQASIWLVYQMYNGLITLDNELNVKPSLAKSWEISDDGLHYTFHLRTDVHFHKNDLIAKERTLKASDVVYSFQRIIDPKVASPGSWIFNDKLAENKPFKALNDSTFQLSLNSPFGPMLSLLSMPYCFVLPEEVVAHYKSDFRKNPVGTGPFQLKVWKEGQVIILEKNQDYFEEGLPKLDAVRVSFIESKETEYLKFIQGDIDFMSGIDPAYIDELLDKEGKLKAEWNDKIELLKAPYLNTEYLGILQSTDNPALNKKTIRQAINYGFDRRQMIRFLRNNIGIPAEQGFIPFGLPGFDPQADYGYSYNPDKARQLIKQSGYSGEKIKLLTNSSYEDIGTYIVRQLNEIGLNIEMDIVPPAFQREMMAKGDADFFRGSWIADYPDAENYLALFYGPLGAPPNYTNYSNPVYDKLYEAALKENNEAERLKLYRNMDSLIMEDAVVVPLYYDQVLRFVQKNISGLNPNPINLLVLKNVSIQKPIKTDE
ncbi:MAG: ABC transporter substrate-binding protein [Chitinophagales bacterium]